MVLKKPYAVFIKLFRPLHFLFIIGISLLIYKQNNILNYLSNYLYTSDFYLDEGVTAKLVSSYLFIIPVILILFSLLMFGVMFRKNKPYKLYFMSIFIFLVIFIVNIYTSNFLKVFETNIVSIKAVKLIHDIVLLTIIVESSITVVFIVRALGINFEKFDFSSDIGKFDIDEKDKEEFELELKFDFNETKRRRNRQFRNFKYFYLENKFMISIISISLIVLVIALSLLLIFKNHKFNKEGIEYNIEDFNILVEDTYILNSNYEGNKITNDYLIIVKTKLSSYYSKFLYSKDFTLKIGEASISPTKNYQNYLLDIGIPYNNDSLTDEYKSFIFTYEIPKKYITSDMYFSYNNVGYNFDISLNPKTLKYGNKTEVVNIGKVLSFEKSLGNIEFNIKEYEISDFYKMEYNYCIKDVCFDSFEYLIPSINENFDKTILKLDLDYTNNSNLSLNNFYDLLVQFGDIYYLKDGMWQIQDDFFEKITSKKTNSKYVYIGINNNIKDSDSIKFVFNIRGLKYEYILK